MREHVRGYGRYFRTEAGKLTLDWGFNGSNYEELDFSYVAKGKMGNMSKVYGRIRRNADGETYDTYDVMIGNDRLKTSRSFSVETAIKSFVQTMTGVCPRELDVKDKMPMLPDSGKAKMMEVLMNALRGMMFCFRGEMQEWSMERKEAFMGSFAETNWRNKKILVDSIKDGVVSVGLVNVAVGKYSNLHRLWRKACDSKIAEVTEASDDSDSSADGVGYGEVDGKVDASAETNIETPEVTEA